MVDHLECPECHQIVVKLWFQHATGRQEYMVFPRGTTRPPVSADVPAPLSVDYTEACGVLDASAKASAALSRRVLQMILRDKTGVKHGRLVDEITQALPRLPSHLQHLDAIRHIGNFAAHPTKDTNTGAIVDVEPGEADWLLDVLEELFDFYFVQPATVQRKKDALNAKLKAAGKPEIP